MHTVREREEGNKRKKIIGHDPYVLDPFLVLSLHVAFSSALRFMPQALTQQERRSSFPPPCQPSLCFRSQRRLRLLRSHQTDTQCVWYAHLLKERAVVSCSFFFVFGEQ
jgi:hypothetical protein